MKHSLKVSKLSLKFLPIFQPSHVITLQYFFIDILQFFQLNQKNIKITSKSIILNSKF